MMQGFLGCRFAAQPSGATNRRLRHASRERAAAHQPLHCALLRSQTARERRRPIPVVLEPPVALIGFRQDYVDASVIKVRDDVATGRDDERMGQLLRRDKLHDLVEAAWRVTLETGPLVQRPIVVEPTSRTSLQYAASG
jgi:hypothetical protein